MKVEVAVRGFPSLTVRTVSEHKATLEERRPIRAQQLCESRGGRPGLPVPDTPCGLCGSKATLNEHPSLIGVGYVASVDVKQHETKEVSALSRPK